MLALSEDEDAARVMRACTVDPEVLADELRAFIDQELGSIQVASTVEEPQPTARSALQAFRSIGSAPAEWHRSQITRMPFACARAVIACMSCR